MQTFSLDRFTATFLVPFRLLPWHFFVWSSCSHRYASLSCYAKDRPVPSRCAVVLRSRTGPHIPCAGVRHSVAHPCTGVRRHAAHPFPRSAPASQRRDSGSPSGTSARAPRFRCHRVAAHYSALRASPLACGSGPPLWAFSDAARRGPAPLAARPKLPCFGVRRHAAHPCGKLGNTRSLASFSKG